MMELGLKDGKICTDCGRTMVKGKLVKILIGGKPLKTNIFSRITFLYKQIEEEKKKFREAGD